MVNRRSFLTAAIVGVTLPFLPFPQEASVRSIQIYRGSGRGCWWEDHSWEKVEVDQIVRVWDIHDKKWVNLLVTETGETGIVGVEPFA